MVPSHTKRVRLACGVPEMMAVATPSSHATHTFFTDAFLVYCHPVVVLSLMGGIPSEPTYQI